MQSWSTELDIIKLKFNLYFLVDENLYEILSIDIDWRLQLQIAIDPFFDHIQTTKPEFRWSDIDFKARG